MTPLDVLSHPESTAPPTEQGATIWLTGLPSAGKSTIAAGLAEVLRADGHRVEVLDGDEVRTFLTAGLGFSRADRDTNVERIGWVAELLARNGVKVISAAISPYASTRASVRARHDAAATPFVEVHVATPVEVCSERDVKGLYAAQRDGRLSGLTGVDDPYEPPTAPELRLHTERLSVDEAVTSLHAALIERGLA
jgi:adenylylsulfate kinase